MFSIGITAGASLYADALAASLAAAGILTSPGRRHIGLTRFGLKSPWLWIVAPVLLSIIWSADRADTAWLAIRVASLCLLLPLAWPRARLAVPLILIGMVVSIITQFSVARPAAFSNNAVTAAELGMFMALSGSAWLAWMAVPLLSITKSRAALLAVAVFAILARRRAIAAVLLVSVVVWLVSAAAAGNLNRLSLHSAHESAAQRADDANIIETGFAESVGKRYGLEPEKSPNRTIRTTLGTGAAAYNESTGVQRPHSAPLLIIQELRLLALPVLVGLFLALRKLPAATALALVFNYTLFSDSIAGDAVTMYGAAIMLSLRGNSIFGLNSAYIPRPAGQIPIVRKFIQRMRDARIARHLRQLHL